MVDQGADAIVLAGPTSDLAFAGHDPGYPVVDALDVHVAVLARPRGWTGGTLAEVTR